MSELEARGLPLGMERPLESRNGWRRLRSLSSVSESGLLPACLSHVQVSAIQVEPSRSRPTPTSSDSPHTTSGRNTSHRGAPKPPERQHRLARQLWRAVRSSWRSRAGVARMSISTILPHVIVKAMTANGRPRSHDNARGASHKRRLCEPGKPREAASSEHQLGHGRRTADHPRGTQRRRHGRQPWTTTSGSRSARSAAKSPSRRKALKG